MKFVWRAVVASLLAVLFLTTAAEATVQNVATHTKIKVSDTSISPGADLFIVGRLKSEKNACRQNLVLKLFFKGNQVGSKHTNNNGKVFFKKHPYSTGKWQIRFTGKKVGKHPNRYYCKPSYSNRVKVVVKGSGNQVLGTGGANAVSGSSSALTGADVLPGIRLLAVLLICGLAAIFVARRRVRSGSSH